MPPLVATITLDHAYVLVNVLLALSANFLTLYNKKTNAMLCSE